MIIKQIRVQNLRIHNDTTLSLGDGLTLISGDNGSGKTSILEAIYIALRGKSFRGVDSNIVRQSTAWYRVDLSTDMGDRVVKYLGDSADRKKLYEINSKTTYRLGEADKHPVVLFEPDDSRIITGSPVRRRHYLDTLISQYDRRYSVAIRRYERALLQRNKQLKLNSATRDSVFVWDVPLSEYGAYIVAKRREVISYLNQHLSSVYRHIAKTNDDIRLGYTCPKAGESPQYLLNELYAKYAGDIAVKSTSVGPHRHDMTILFNKKDAIEVCSRGEKRTILLALKFIEAQYIYKLTEKKPIILLDDVFGELDASRQQQLLDEFHDNQLIITTTNSNTVHNGVNYVL